MRNMLGGKKVGVWGGPLFGSLVAVTLVACLVGSPARAEVFTVNELSVQEVGKHDIADFGDDLPGDGIAERAIGSGETTLRAAMEEANALPGHDTILLPGGQSTKHYIHLPPLTDPAGVTIMSTGTGKFTLDGSVAGNRLVAYAGLINTNFMALDTSPMDDRLSYFEARNVVSVAFDAVIEIFQNLYFSRGLNTVSTQDFSDMDINGDGFLTADELSRVNPSEEGFVLASPNNNIINVIITGCPGIGIKMSGTNVSNNVIQGCLIGTSGTADQGNADHGILLANGAHDNLIGGTTEDQRNVVSGNGGTAVDADMDSTEFGHGILIDGPGSMNNVIIGNYIGVGSDGTTAVPNAFSGIVIQNSASNNVIGGMTEAERNIIAGNGITPDGCDMNCGYGHYFEFGHGVFIDFASNNTIQGNWIGVTASETTLGNRSTGILVESSVGTVIGGDTPEAGNVVCGQIVSNFWNYTGILTDGTIDTRIENNYIGVLPDGSSQGANFFGLVMIGDENATVGGPGRGNLISGNVRGAEVFSCPNSVFQGNFIGTDATGTQSIPNDDSGLLISGFYDVGETTLIGGSEPGEGNVISGNFDDGIVVTTVLSAAAEPVMFIQGNYIGVDVTGNAPLPNTVIGILLDSGSQFVQVGGSGQGEGNIISGNGLDGIRVARSVFGFNATQISILGNSIGLTANGTPLGNAINGITILEGAQVNQVGGIGEGEGNIITGNADYGVRIKGGSASVTERNTVRGNSIYGNGLKGIVLQRETGGSANNDIAAPVITGVGPVAGTALSNSIIDLYGDAENEGRVYLGSGATDGSGNFSIAGIDLTVLTAMSLDMLTATVTDSVGNTSEFSAPFSIAPPTIDTHPVSRLVVEGDPFTLMTEASGSQPLLYRWQFLSAELGGDFVDLTNDGIFTGATENTLANSAARLTDEGSYQCVVTNAIDTVTTVVVTVTVVPLSTNTVVVSTTNDTSDGDTRTPAHLFVNPGADGLFSLREAIDAANNRAGADTITFSVTGTITPDGGLPSLEDLAGGTTIDGGGTITLDGQNLGGSIGGFRLTSVENVLAGLTIVNFPGNGVDISDASATGNMVLGCQIGTDGTAPHANGIHGVVIQNGASDNVVGGPAAGQGNIISGNTRSGVYLTSANTTGNLVQGNLIGLSAAGTSAIANGESGIGVVTGASANQIGGETAGEGNVISANNAAGVRVAGAGGTTDGNIVAGNTIGLDANGASGLGNVTNGIEILSGATNTVVGGTSTAAANVISGNGDSGVLVDGPASLGNTIRFNSILGNFGGGIGLSAGGNADIEAPDVAVLAGVVLGTAAPDSTIDIYTDEGSEGALYLETVTADGNGDFTGTADLEPVVGRNVTATATDAAGNTSEFSAPVLIDLEPPVLTLLGQDPATVQCGSVYTDAGVSAIDDVDGDITHRVVRTITFGANVVGSVNTSVLGTYTILYEVSDNAGQAATPVMRSVDVVDTAIPVITLNGQSSVVVECSAGFTDPGATAADTCDGTITVAVAGAVNTDSPGVYPLVYSATDSQGNVAVEVTRTVTVVDTTLPVITLNGNIAVALECGTPYLDAGATVTDSCDTTVEVVVDNPVEPGVPGVYSVLYNAVDASGNAAVQRFRTVTVADTTPPAIALLGAADLTVECGVAFNDPGAVVTDVCEGTLPAIVTGSVNTAAPGNYTLVYAASDSSGNVATTVTRVVRVADHAVPAIALIGPQTVNIPCEGTYEELGATAGDNCEGDLTDEIIISGTVDVTTPGQYTVNYDVVDSVGNSAARVFRTVVVATCPAPCEDQCATDPDNEIDEDGDGLSACVEACLGTDDQLIDSDGDGVPDNVEIVTGTNPVLPDSDLDLDGDGLTALEEFIFDSDPLDPNSPASSFFVSPNGQDVAGGGTAAAPWRTIGYALAQSAPSAVNNVRIILAPGNYPEDVELLPWVSLVGAVGELPRIEGTVFGADNSNLINLEIAAFTTDDVMLVMDNVAMSVENVVFRGSVARPAAGILADGLKTAGSMIDGCLFASVSIGIDVGGALPVVRRCTFEDTTIAGIFVRGTASIPAGGSVGDVNDPSTGSNLFSGVTQGRAIINELGTELLAQQNDWGTTNITTIKSTLLSGPVNVEPVLPPGSAADTASLYVTVWTAKDQDRIGNATVTVKRNNDGSVVVRTNRNGVYSLPVLRAGNYTVSVTALGYNAQDVAVTLEAGELGSRIVALVASVDKAGGPSCNAVSGGAGGIGTGDLLLALLLLSGLLLGLRGTRGSTAGRAR